MKARGIIGKILVILFWIGIWAAAAYQIDKPLLLPSPVSVFAHILDLMLYADFWRITGLSLLRICLGIFSATLLGILLAIVTTYSQFMDTLLSPFQTIIKVTPVASFILLVLIWLDRNIVPAVISTLMVLPIVWNNVSAGLSSIDHSFVELARVYHLSLKIRLKRIILPSVMPYFLSAVQTSIGIGWKAGIAAEVLTVPIYSIGKMISESKMYMETVDLFAWTIVVILISLCIEKTVVTVIKRFGTQYRSEVARND